MDFRMGSLSHVAEAIEDVQRLSDHAHYNCPQ